MLLAAFAPACAPRLARVDPQISPGRTWTSALERGHPLVGRIWNVREKRFSDAKELGAALVAADFVLLGETHDNPDHHLMEAELVQSIASRGRHPALAFEMLDTGQQALVDAAVAHAPSPDAIAASVAWDASGWPPFSLYRPVFAAGLDARLPIVAANLSSRTAGQIMRQGASAVPPDLREELDRVVLPEATASRWRAEMLASHCGSLPEKMLDPMVLAQRARDLRLARSLVGAAGARGAILIAGGGHVRNDRAVPVWLARLAPGRRTLSVAFLEASPEALAPDDYADGALPYDFAVFTPATERTDPCEAFRLHPPRP